MSSSSGCTNHTDVCCRYSTYQRCHLVCPPSQQAAHPAFRLHPWCVCPMDTPWFNWQQPHRVAVADSHMTPLPAMITGIPVQVAMPVFQVPLVHSGVALGSHPAGQLTVQMVPCPTEAAVQAVGTDAPALTWIPGLHGAGGCSSARQHFAWE